MRAGSSLKKSTSRFWTPNECDSASEQKNRQQDERGIAEFNLSRAHPHAKRIDTNYETEEDRESADYSHTRRIYHGAPP
jgi:hypothetical protein